MTTQLGPDATALKSWEEAFQYPLPTVRKLSTKLRKDIDEHRVRLRSLVGASYRDLLGTAERIVDMDKQIQDVESTLSKIGQRCNSRILERSDANYLQIEKSWAQTQGEDVKLKRAALTRVLSAALNVVSRLVKKNGNALQASKLMVLARLLYKSLTDEGDSSPQMDKYRRTITALRSKVLAHIDRLLGKQDEGDSTPSTLAAFALLSSSTPRDVLRHFLAVRAAKVEEITQTPTSEAILTALSLHSVTFTSVQALFPRRVAESLSALAKVPLLSDTQLRNVDELNLDVFGRWIPVAVQSFTPWVQQEALSPSEGRQTLLDYGNEVRAVLLQAVRQCLAGISEAGEVLDIRKRVLGAYLRVGKQIRTSGFEEQINELRDVFVSRLEHLAKDSAKADDIFIGHTASARERHSSLWDLADGEIDLSAGAKNFRNMILRHHHGHDAGFDEATAPLVALAGRIEKQWECIESMRSTKWEEYLETDLEEDDEDDDEAHYHTVLSVEDPDQVAACLRQSADQALNEAFSRLEKAVHDEGSHSTEQTSSHIRLLRELNRQHRHISGLIGSAALDLSNRRKLSTMLHSQLAASVIKNGIYELQSAFESAQFIPTELWEGGPKLPSQPMPASFRFVTSLQQNMGAAGHDLWSPEAVKVVKEDLVSKLVPVLQSTIANALRNGHDTEVVDKASTEPDDQVEADSGLNGQLEASAENGIVKTDGQVETSAEKSTIKTDGQSEAGEAVEGVDAKQEQEDHAGRQPDITIEVDHSAQYTQHLFDALWLRRILATKGDVTPLDQAVETLQQRSSLEDAAFKRLDKNATEYWRKTYLLFGLLT